MADILGLVRAKYPQYADVDDGDLAGALAQRYPQYLNDPDFHKLVNPGEPGQVPHTGNPNLVSTIAGGPPMERGADDSSLLPETDYAETGQIIPREPLDALQAPSVWAQRGGKLLLGAMADLASTATGKPTTANMDSYANTPSEDMPVETGLKEMHGMSSVPTKAAAGLIRAVPQIGEAIGLGMAGAPSAVASAVPMLDNQEGQIDPYGALIAAGLPGVSGYGEKFVASQLAKLPTAHVVAEILSRDPLQVKAKVVQRLGGVEISNDVFRKYLEAGGGAVAANAYLLASQAPQIMQLPPNQRGDAIMDSVAGNLATSMMAFASRPGTSGTLQELRPKLQKLWEQTQDAKAVGAASAGAPGETAGGTPLVTGQGPNAPGPMPVNPVAKSPVPPNVPTRPPVPPIVIPTTPQGGGTTVVQPPAVTPGTGTVTKNENEEEPTTPKSVATELTPKPTPEEEKPVLTGWQKHVDTLNTPGLPDERYGEALAELTGDDATKFIPNMQNNMRIALGRSMAHDFKTLAEKGIVPGANVLFNGDEWTVKNFDLDGNATTGMGAELLDYRGARAYSNVYRLQPAPDKAPALMTPEEYEKYAETLPPHEQHFVPASSNEYGVPIYGHNAAIYNAVKKGLPVPAENLTQLKEYVRGAMASQAEVKANDQRIIDAQRPYLNGWTTGELLESDITLKQMKDEAFRLGGVPGQVNKLKTPQEAALALAQLVAQHRNSGTAPTSLSPSTLPPKVAPTAAHPAPGAGDTYVGQNEAGEQIYEDENGIKSPRSGPPATPSTRPPLPTYQPGEGKNSVLSHPGNQIADMVRSRLLAGEAINAAAVRIAGEKFGLDERQAGEWAELGATEAARELAQDPNMTDREKFHALVSLYERMPVNGTRTTETKVNQQYSTPPPLAFAAGILADLKHGTRLLEPTAGHGMLTIAANWNGSIGLNELDPQRRYRLVRYMISAPNSAIKDYDATSQDYADKAKAAKPDRVIMNPPFGNVMQPDGSMKKFTVSGSAVKNKETTSMDTAIMLNVFNALGKDGKGVAIIGAKTGTPFAGKFGTDAERAADYKKPMFLDLFHRFNVVDWFTIGGDLYRKMGAAAPVDVVVVHGKSQTPSADNGGMVRPWVKPPRVLTTWEEVAKLIPENELDAIKTGGAGSPHTGGGAGGTHPGTGGAKPKRPGTPEVSTAGHQRPAGSGGATGERNPKPDVESPNPTPKPPDERDGATSAGIGKGTPEPAGDVAGGGAEGKPPVAPGMGGTGEIPARPGEAETGGHDVERPLVGFRPEDEKRLTEENVTGNFTPFGYAGMRLRRANSAFRNAGKWADLDAAGRARWQRAKAEITAAASLFSRIRANPDDVETKRQILTHQRDMLRGDLQNVKPAFRSDSMVARDLAKVEAMLASLPKSQPKTPTPSVPTEGLPASLMVPYQGVSKGYSLKLVAPRNIANQMVSAQKALEQEVGKPIDQYVADALGRDVKTLHGQLAGAQIDTAALAIRNIERGSALICAHETGVGKGRVVAALIEYARLKGLIPIFVTAKPNLYSDMVGRDLPALGNRDFVPFITNTTYDYENGRGKDVKGRGTSSTRNDEMEAIIRTGNLPGGAHGVFTTYDQLKADKPVGFSETPKQKFQRQVKGRAKPDGPRFAMLRALAPRAIFILDESHQASGPTSDINLKMKEILPPASGIYYSSATFAKRPDNLGLYAIGTLMKKSGLNNEQMTEALTKGGVPLQQALTSMLAESGELIRLQQDWTGVEMRFESTGGANEVEAADNYTSFLRDLMTLANQINQIGAGLENAENQVKADEAKVKVEEITFASRLFSLSNQYLFSLRAQAVVNKAVSELKAGRKPFIHVHNTLEGPMADLKARKLPLSFGGMLRREMQKMLTLTVRDPMEESGKKKVELQPDDLPDGGKFYRQMEEEIMGTDWSGFPISPIDHIKNGIKAAGYSIGEITARDGEVDDTGVEPVITKREKQERGKILKNYNNGVTDVLLINGSGGTGLSAHTDPSFKDQRQRSYIEAQPAPDINDEMQAMGRTMRSGQTSKPKFTFLTTQLAAERRFATMLRGKMTSLNANTTAEGESGVTQNEGFAEDIFNQVGDDVVFRVMEANDDIARLLDLNVSGGVADENFARYATGKFPLLPNADADRLWNEIIDEYKEEIERLDEAGENPLRATAEDLKAQTLETTEIQHGDGNTVFDGPVNIEKCQVKPPKAPPTHAEARQRASDNVAAIRERVREFVDKSRAAEEERIAIATQRGAKEEGLERIRQNFENVRLAVVDAARKIGDTFGVDTYGDGSSAYYAVAAEMKLADKSVSNFASASRQQLVLTTNTFRGRQTIPLSKLYKLGQEQPYLNPMDDDEGAEQFDNTAESNAERYIVTGNLLRGWDLANSFTVGQDIGKPRVAIYTKHDGSLGTGILMPSAWDAATRNIGGAQEVIKDRTQFAAAVRANAALRSLATSSVHPVRVAGGNLYVPSSGQGRLLWSDPDFNGFFRYPPQQVKGEFVGMIRPDETGALFDFLQSKGVMMATAPGQDAAAMSRAGNRENSATMARGGFVSGVSRAPGGVPTSVTFGGMQFVRPLQLPELVRLTRDLTGAAPSVRRLPQRGNQKTYGQFGDGMITLDPLIFKDSAMAAAVLGHELGHLVDYLPHETLKRGNLLGHLLALKGWLKQKFGTLNNAELKKELMAVTMWWRPYDPAKDPKTYVAYRQTPEELYADALSVMFNAPAELEQRAPKFYDAFWKEIGKRPAVENALFNVQEYLNKGMLPTAQERENALMEGFKQGEAIWKQAVADREAMAKSFDHWWENLAQELYWDMYPLEKRAKIVEGRGVKLAQDKDPRHFLDDYGYRNTTVMRWGRHVFEKVLQPLEAAGMTIDDVGKYLFFRRILDGDRAQLANSGGIDPTAARLGLLKMRLELGMGKMTVLAHHVKIFHDDVFKLAEQAVQCGAYNKQTFENVIKPNRDTYATFAVLDYLDDYLPPGISQQIGTLKATANSFPATILKSIGLINLIARQQALNKTMTFLQQYFPDDISRAGDTHPTAKKGKGTLMRLENGRPAFYYTDPYIARAFEKMPAHLLWSFVKPMDWAFRKLVYPLIITYNPAFLYLMQPGRDIQRTGRNLPGFRMGGVGLQPINYLRNIPAMTGRFKGNPSDIIREMEANLGIASPFDMLTRGHRDDFMGDLLRRMNVLPQSQTKGIFASQIFKPIRGLLDRMEFGGNVLIDLSRVAAYTQLRKQGMTPKHAAYWVRNYSGIPNLNKRGLLIRQMRALVPFWNVFLQGWRADIHLATEPTTRGGWWMRYMMGNGLVRLLLAGAAAGAFGAALKELFDGIGAHDKANYLCLPVGQTSGGDFGKRTVYIRFPEDFTGRMIGGMIQKGTAQMTGQNPEWGQLLDFGMGQFPDLNPAMTVPEKWREYAMGRNPQDDFRGQQIIPDRVFKAGDHHGAEVMGVWTLNQVGILNLLSFNPQAQTTTELGLSALPGINKFVKVTDQGYRETQRAEQTAIDAQRDMQFLKLPDQVQSLELEYWRLERINKDTRTPEQEDRLADLKTWYANTYRPAWEAIQQAVAEKQAGEAATLRKGLDQDSAEYYPVRK